MRNEYDIARLFSFPMHVRGLDVADMLDQRVEARSNFSGTPKMRLQ